MSAVQRPRGPKARPIETVGDLLYHSYANLGMAHSALERGLTKYDQLSYVIRNRLLGGLRKGTMNVGTLFSDVREMPSDRCAYCAAVPPPSLHADHLIPRHRGGPESGDNLVWACRTCNSSKGKRDLLEWYASRDDFAPLAVLRRYLKLAIAEAREKDCIHIALADAPAVTFCLEHVPVRFPAPSLLRWTA